MTTVYKITESIAAQTAGYVISISTQLVEQCQCWTLAIHKRNTHSFKQHNHVTKYSNILNAD